MNNIKENYKIMENYHGDIKLTKSNDNNTVEKIALDKGIKKVDLSKPTDTTIKPIVNLNFQNGEVSKKSDIVCLTKPQDIQKSIQSSNINMNNSRVVNTQKLSKVSQSSVNTEPSKLKTGIKIGLGLLLFFATLISIGFGSLKYIPLVLIIELIALSPLIIIVSTIILMYSILKYKTSKYSKLEYMENIIMSAIILIVYLVLIFLLIGFC